MSTDTNPFKPETIPQPEKKDLPADEMVQRKENIDKNIAEIPDQVSPPPGSENLPVDEEILKLLISNQRVRDLWIRADGVQTQINEEINSIRLAHYLLDLIQRARNELMSGKSGYEEAERALNEVSFRLAFNRRVIESSRTVGRNLLIYEGIWLLLLGGGITLINLFESRFSSPFLSQFLSSLFWGGLGGVVGALYALWKHIADSQDFDRQYTIWYVTNPLLGIALGAFVFLVIQAGFFSLTASDGTAESVKTPMVIYVLAWISGLKQNVVYDIVRRILDVFRVGEEKTEISIPQTTEADPKNQSSK